MTTSEADGLAWTDEGDGGGLPLQGRILLEVQAQLLGLGYSIDSPLGEGGSADVFRALRVCDGRPVALKILRTGNRPNGSSRVLLEREVTVLQTLVHPNIVTCLGTGEFVCVVDGASYEFFFIILELGHTTLAAELLRRGGRLPPREAVEVLAEIGEAVAHAHSQDPGVLHLDLKPANVIQVGTVWKLTDFNIARFRTADGYGTPNFRALELLRSRQDAPGPQADVFGLGATLYTTLTGAFIDERRMERRQLQQAPENLVPDVPRDLARVVMAGIHVDPRWRYAMASDFVADLRRWLAGEPVQPPVEPAWSRYSRAMRQRSVMVAALVALLALMSYFGLTFFRQQRQNERLQAAAKQAIAADNQAKINAKLLLDSQYETSVSLMPRLWNEGRHFELAELLDRLTPNQGDDDRRSFEWYYWRSKTCSNFLIKAHTGSARALAIAPTGTLAASSGQDCIIKLWDLATGREVRSLVGHTLPVTAVAFSSDSRELVSVASNVDRPNAGGEIKLWDLKRGLEVASAKTPLVLITTVTFSPDGKHVVTGGMHNTMLGPAGSINVWNKLLRRETSTQPRLRQMILCVQFSPDGTVLASGSSPGPRGAGELTIWNASNWREVRKVGTHQAGIWSVAFTPDGKKLISGGMHKSVQIWDLASGREEGALEGHSLPVSRVLVSPDGRALVAASFDATIKFWDLKSLKEMITLRGHDGFVNNAEFSPDGRLLVTAGSDGTIRFWDGAVGERSVTEVPAQNAESSKICLSADGRLLAWTNAKSGSGEVGLWDMAAGKVIFSHKDPETEFHGVAFSRHGPFLAVGTGQRGKRTGRVQIWNLVTRKASRVLDCQAGWVSRVAYTPDGRRLISTDGAGGLLTVWDTRSGVRLSDLRGHSLNVYALALGPDGKRIASGAGIRGSGSGELIVWDTNSGKKGDSFLNLVDGVADLAFSPDGRQLAVANFGNVVRVHDLDGKEPVLELGHARIATSVAYSPDGRRIATGSYDGTIAIWNSLTGHKLLALRAHKGHVDSLAFTPDGFSLASAGGDGRIKIWNAGPSGYTASLTRGAECLAASPSRGR